MLARPTPLEALSFYQAPVRAMTADLPPSERFPVRYLPSKRVWEVDVRPHGRIRSVLFPGARTRAQLVTEAMAREVRRIILQDIERGVPEKTAVSPYLPQESHVEKVIESWLVELERRVDLEKRSPNYTRRLRKFQKGKGGHWQHLYGETVHSLNYATIADWTLELLENGVHETTVFHAASALRTALRWHAKRSGGTYACPEFPELKRGKYTPELLEPAQQNAVLEQIPENARGAFLFMADLMARPGEARAVLVSQYDFRTREFDLQNAIQGPRKDARRGSTKGRDRRILVATDRLAAWLEEHVSKERRLARAGVLFESPEAQDKDFRWADSTLRHTWDRARSRVEGLPRAGLYTGTKHSTATWLRRNAGFSLEEIGLALGHAHARREQAVTEGYAQPPRIVNGRIAKILDSR